MNTDVNAFADHFDISRSFLKLVQPRFIFCHASMANQVKEHARQVHVMATLITLEASQDNASIQGFLDNDDEDIEFV